MDLLAEAIRTSGGAEAVSLRVAEQYLDAFKEIAKKGTTMLLPSTAHDPASMVAQALSIYGTVAGDAAAARRAEDAGNGGDDSSGKVAAPRRW